MKPAPFEYHAPATLGEALRLLSEAGDDGKLLAGGQSLVPLLNMRVLRPSALIDLNGVPELRVVKTSDGNGLSLGAMVRQRTLERDPLIRERVPLLSEAAALIGHMQIRTRGTLGGSLVHADPAAELPAAVTALSARLTVRGPSGVRTLSSEEFFIGPLTTALAPGEVLVDVLFPPLPPGTGWAFVELTRRHGDFAIVGAAALAHLDGAGRVDFASMALCGTGGTPYASPWLGDVLHGERPRAELIQEVGRRLSESVEPDGDIHASAGYRRKVAGVIGTRALALALDRAQGPHRAEVA